MFMVASISTVSVFSKMTSSMSRSYAAAQKHKAIATRNETPAMRHILLSESGIRDAMNDSVVCVVFFMILSSSL